MDQREQSRIVSESLSLTLQDASLMRTFCGIIDDPVLHDEEGVLSVGLLRECVKGKRSSRVGVAELDKAKLGGRVDDQILGHPRHMPHRRRSPLKELDDKVSVPSSVQ